MSIVIDNTNDSAIKSGKWSNPGASLFDAICKEGNYKSLLNEAYLLHGDIDKSDKLTYSNSGCKYPHHVIREGKLVVSEPGVKAAYQRAKQMGIFKGEVKKHLERHYRELGIFKDSTMNESANRISENFEFIESFLGIDINKKLHDDIDQQQNSSHSIFDKIDCNTPEELMQWMNSHIQYDKDITMWRLKSPETTAAEGKGNCHDQSLFQKAWFDYHDISNKQIFFIEYNEGEEVGGSTHTFSTFIGNDGMLYWFEHSWENYRGIHGPFNSRDDLVNYVHECWKKDDDINQGKYQDISFFYIPNYEIGMTLGTYVESWYIDKAINESLSWIDSFVHNDYFREAAINEASHGNLKYCYRIGFDVNTGNQVAVEFILNPNEIVPPSKDLDKTQLWKGSKMIDPNKSPEEISDSILKMTAAIKKNIKKSGYIDFISGPLTVNAIIVRTGKNESNKSLKDVDLIPFMNASVNTIIAKVLNVKKIDENLSYDDKLDVIFSSNEFKNEIKSFGKHENYYGIIEHYKVGELGGNDKYKTTKLIWKHGIMCSNAFTTVLRGFVKYGPLTDGSGNMKTEVDDGLIELFTKNKGILRPKDYKESIVIDALYQEYNYVIGSIDSIINPSWFYDYVPHELFEQANELQNIIGLIENDSNVLSYVCENMPSEEIYSNNDILDELKEFGVERIWFITSDDGVDNCCIKVKGYDKPMRGRSAMITLKHENDGWFVLCKQNKDDYGVPGGGWNKGEEPMDAAIRELGEETLSKAKDVKRIGTLIEYHEDVAQWVKDHVANPDDWWYGYYSAVFVGIYDGEYEGKVDEHDREYCYQWKNTQAVINEFPKEYSNAIKEYLDRLNKIPADEFNEKSHGGLHHSFRLCINKVNGHLIKVVFDLKPEDIRRIGSHDDTNPVPRENWDEIKKNINKTGFNDFTSMATCQAIIDMDTGEHLQSVKAVGVMNGNQQFARKTLQEREKWIEDGGKFYGGNKFTVGEKEDEDSGTWLGSYKTTTPAKSMKDLEKIVNPHLHKESTDMLDQLITEADDDTNKEESETAEDKSEPIESTEEEKKDDILDEPIEDDNVKPDDEPPAIEPKSLPKQTDEAEANKNGVNRKKLYIAFIEWCKEYNQKNTFGSNFDKDVFKVTYPFVPNEMRYFYRLANPNVCVLSGDLTFFPLADLRKLNSSNKKMNELLIFAATPNDMRVFSVKDKQIYLAIESEDGGIKLTKALANTFDLYLQNMIKKGDILNSSSEDKESEDEEMEQ